MPAKPRLLTALDVGNHRVLALIGELEEDASLIIRGVGVAASSGMRHGQVVQMRPVVGAIRSAVEEAELMAKLPVERVLASVAGTFVSGRMTRASITLGTREREVNLRDLEQLDEAARRQPLPPGHIVLNVLTHSYALDDQEGILDPQDMVGRQLAMDAYVVLCQDAPVRTLEKAINAAGLQVDEFLFSPVPAALATLTDDERRLGAVVIDIGYGLTSYAALHGDRVVAAGCFPIGSDKINDDLVHRFQTTAAGAERAKVEAGTMLVGDIGEDETIAIPAIHGRGNQVVSRLEMSKIMRIRMQETLELVASDVLRQVAEDVSFTSIVVCGGGAHVEGLAALAEEVFAKRARLGEIEGVADATSLLESSELPSRSPAVAAGLLAHGRRLALPDAPAMLRTRRSSPGLLARILRRLRGNKEVAR